MNGNDLKNFKRDIIKIVLGATLPFVITAIIFLVDDHYKIKSLKRNMVTKEYLYVEMYRWEQLQESKIRNLEIMATGSETDVIEAKQELDELRKRIDDHIDRTNRTRGLPEAAIIKQDEPKK